MRYHKTALLLVGIIILCSMAHGILSTEDVLGGSHPENPHATSLPHNTGGDGNAEDKDAAAHTGSAGVGKHGHPHRSGTFSADGLDPMSWNLLQGDNYLLVIGFFPIRFLLSGLVCLTTGELVLVCSGLAYWMTAGLQRVLGGPRFFQLVLLMWCVRLPVWTSVYIPLGQFVTSEAGLLGAGGLWVQPSATWIVASMQAASWWLVPAKLKFTLLNTVPLNENVFGWLLVAHLALVRWPLSLLDCVVGILVGTISVSSFCYLSKFKVPKYLKWLDPGHPLIWHTPQDPTRLAATAAQSFGDAQPVASPQAAATPPPSLQPATTTAASDVPGTGWTEPVTAPPRVSETTYELFYSLGYDRETTERAIAANNNNPDIALDRLLTGQQY